jgi:hypothetical protein
MTIQTSLFAYQMCSVKLKTVGKKVIKVVQIKLIRGLFCFVIALRPQTPKHIRGGWSQYTDTSEPVDGGVGTLQL